MIKQIKLNTDLELLGTEKCIESHCVSSFIIKDEQAFDCSITYNSLEENSCFSIDFINEVMIEKPLIEESVKTFLKQKYDIW